MIQNNSKDVNRLEKTLAELKSDGKKALAVFLMGGDPDLQISGKILRAAIEGGADILEIGVPFSDPMADGPVNQKAAQRSLNNGTSINDILNLSEDIRKDFNIPIALLLYYNTIYRFGPSAFLKQAKHKGIDALVIPDLPFEEKKEVAKYAEQNDIIIIDFIAPTSSDKRMGLALKKARGFIYCVTVTGVTGVRESISPDFKSMIENARSQTNVPLLAGFGISTTEQAREAVVEADGIIVGSVFVREVEHHMGNKEVLPGIIREKVSAFKKAITS